MSHSIFSLINAHAGDSSQTIHLQFTVVSFTGIMLSLSGGLLRIYCFDTLGRFFTFDFCIRKDHKLITAGPYSIVRHPSYSGYILAYFGMLLYHSTPGSLLTEWLSTFPDIFYVRRIMAGWFILRAMRRLFWFERAIEEDKGLKKTFGRYWEIWAKHDKYRILPFPSCWDFLRSGSR